MEPIKLANVLQIDRPNQGELSSVALYRLLRLVALEDILGKGASAVSYYAGKKLGKELGLKSLDELLALCDQLKMGIIKVPVMEEEHIHVDVHECVTCSGLDPVGRPICQFEGGLIAGAVEGITGKNVDAKEVTCIGGLGDETCGFDLTIR